MGLADQKRVTMKKKRKPLVQEQDLKKKLDETNKRYEQALAELQKTDTSNDETVALKQKLDETSKRYDETNNRYAQAMAELERANELCDALHKEKLEAIEQLGAELDYNNDVYSQLTRTKSKLEKATSNPLPRRAKSLSTNIKNTVKPPSLQERMNIVRRETLSRRNAAKTTVKSTAKTPPMQSPLIERRRRENAQIKKMKC